MVNNARQFLNEYGLIIKNDINNYYEKMKRGLDVDSSKNKRS